MTDDNDKQQDPAEATTDTAAAIIAARAAVDIGPRFTHISGANGEIPIAIDGAGRVHVMEDVVKHDDARAQSPVRRRGQAQLDELESFTQYVNRFKNSDTVAWASLQRFEIAAVFNEHPAGGDLAAAGFRDNRAVYACPRSPEWVAWTSNDGKAMRQEAFADWLDARMDDLVGPRKELPDFPHPTDLLGMARKLHINVQGKFKREINATTGEGSLVCTTEHGADSTPIPKAFLLNIPVFQSGVRYYVECRITFRLQDGAAVFAYTMHNRVPVEQAAFHEVRAAVERDCQIPVLAGQVG